MNDTRARRLVLGALVAAAAVAFVRDGARGELPRARALYALLLVAAVLLAATDVAPNLAVSFAALIAVSAALGAGPAAFKAASSALNRTNRRIGDTPA